ncbi:MAG: ESPR-type extended signal peptide-containing protein, partial [Actinobacillus minor]|nr:ESPR-type extended signal peptide-containing protein [Actinobacillus minor]
MNKIFKVIWNHAAQRFDVVSELTHSKGKSSSKTDKRVSLSQVALAVGMSVAGVSIGNDAQAAVTTTSQLTTRYCLQNPNTGVTTSCAEQYVYNTGDTNTKFVGYANGNKAALGVDAKVDDNGVALGYASNASSYSVAVGKSATATNISTAVGESAKATGLRATALGNNAIAQGSHSTAVGDYSKSSGTYAVAIGKATSSGENSTAIGRDAVANGASAIALGRNTTATKAGATSVGNEADATGDFATALGHESAASGNSALALGSKSSATIDGSVALGSGSATSTPVSTPNHTIVGTNVTFAGGSAYSTVSVGNATATRTITNVAAGRLSPTSTDAVNGSQLYTIASALENQVSNTYFHTYTDANQGRGGNAQTNLGLITDAAGATGLKSVTAGVNTTASGTNSIAIGNTSNASGNGGIAIGNVSNATNLNATAIGNQANAKNENTVAIGSSATALAAQAIAIGKNANVSKNSASMAIAIGDNATTSGANAFAIGSNATSSENLALAIGSEANATSVAASAYGYQANAKGHRAVALGAHTNSSGNASTVLGYNSTVTGNYSSSIGMNNNVTANNTFVLGNNVTSTADNNVILGNGSNESSATATNGRPNTITDATVGRLTYSSANFAGLTAAGVVSVGAQGAERRIINVAAGNISATSTDAINGSQLYHVAEKLDASIGSLTFKGEKTGNGTPADTGTKWDTNTNRTISIKSAEAYGQGVDRYTGNNLEVYRKDTNDGQEFHILMKETPTFNGANMSNATITNVGNGTNATDAVNLQQLNATKTYVKSGKNTNVTTTTNADGSKNYTVNAESPFEYVAEDGSKLVLIDGKLYKADQLNADGSLKDGATPYTGATKIYARDNNGKMQVVSNIANGNVANGSHDAVTGDQLYNYVNVNGKAATNSSGKVNFVNGTGTSVTLDSNGNISYNVLNTTLTTITSGNTAGSISIPTGADANKFVTAGDLVTTLNSMGWRVTSAQDGGTVSGTQTEQLIKAGDLVKLVAGDNINIKQEGNNFTFSTTAPKNGKDGDTITVTDNGNGSYTYVVKDAEGNIKNTTIIKDGTTGATGATGANGTSVSVSGSTKDTNGNTIISFTDGSTATISKGDTGAAGATGEKGADGKSISVSGSTKDANGNTIISFTDGSTATVAKGDTGAAGAKGDTGASISVSGT